MATLHLSLRTNVPKLHIYTLRHVNLSDTVDTIIQKAATESKTTPDKIQLIHQGVVLKASDTLKDAGVASGDLIHCLPKSEDQPPIAVPLSLPEVQTLLVSLRNVAASPNFRDFIQKLRGPEMVEKILSSCPIARSEPAALAMLQDPELFMDLTNPENLSTIVDAQPAVGRVAQYVASLMTSETMSPRRSHHVSYSMDALSDDDEMDADQSEDSTSGSRASGSIPFQPITPAQLAAALASATGNSNNGSTNRLPTSAPRSIPTTPSAATTTPFNTPAPSAGAPAAPGPITHEMFSNALQNALAASASRASGPSSSSSSSGPPSASIQIPNLEESLQLMREMGIPDEDLSRQALQATNGDVQAAVNLIFAQWMADD
ncbi:ubiquitin-like protein 7 [Homarus americanus]|uniref:ubiquitin-like protein 7 n=1 Tax=Homarus americanus TaxID=6706 RepID=UPI001C48501B|nr:ubiquitin-like protein 7 [Homarus americanus]